MEVCCSRKTPVGEGFSSPQSKQVIRWPVSIILSETIRAPIENVFAFLSNYERTPQDSNYWRFVKLLEAGVPMGLAEPQADIAKASSVTFSEHPNDKLEATASYDEGGETKMIFKFLAVAEGTLLTIEGDIVLPGVEEISEATKMLIESAMRRELDIMKRAVEKP